MCSLRGFPQLTKACMTGAGPSYGVLRRTDKDRKPWGRQRETALPWSENPQDSGLLIARDAKLGYHRGLLAGAGAAAARARRRDESDGENDALQRFGTGCVRDAWLDERDGERGALAWLYQPFLGLRLCGAG